MGKGAPDSEGVVACVDDGGVAVLLDRVVQVQEALWLCACACMHVGVHEEQHEDKTEHKHGCGARPCSVVQAVEAVASKRSVVQEETTREKRQKRGNCTAFCFFLVFKVRTDEETEKQGDRDGDDKNKNNNKHRQEEKERKDKG